MHDITDFGFNFICEFYFINFIFSKPRLTDNQGDLRITDSETKYFKIIKIKELF